MHRWRGVTRRQDKEAHTHTHTIHIYLAFAISRKSKNVEVVGAEISPINSVLVRIKCL